MRKSCFCARAMTETSSAITCNAASRRYYQRDTTNLQCIAVVMIHAMLKRNTAMTIASG